MSKEIQPIYILGEGSSRTTGKTAQSNNILAAKLVAETVRSTLGPKGMDKMLVNSMGDVVITNDGATILKEMDISHPAAKMLVEVAKTQESEVGDGTTTVVVLAGEFLKRAEILLEQEIHPTAIINGYRMAGKKAIEILNSFGQKISSKDSDILEKIASTAMTGKGAEVSKDVLAKIVVKAVQQVAEDNLFAGKKVDIDSKITIDRNDIKIEKNLGGSIEDTTLVEGIVLDKERVHPEMPRVVNDAKILLLDSPIEIKNTEIDAKISITNPKQMQEFIEQEGMMLKSMVDNITKTGANVVICSKGIDDLAQHFLAKRNIYAIRRVKKSDIEKLAKATKGKIVSQLSEVTEKELGRAGKVEAVKIKDEEMTYVTNCKNPKAVTIIVRGGTEHIVDEVKRALEDAIGDVSSALKTGTAVAGAGAIEIELSKELRKFAHTVKGKEQHAVIAFADSLDIIPKTLAENAGLDPIDIISELKSVHAKKGNESFGIDVFSGKVVNSWSKGVIEPLKLKTQAVSSATEVTTMILRIDDIVMSSGGAGNSGPRTPPMGDLE